MIHQVQLSMREDIKLAKIVKKTGLNTNEWITILVLRELGELNSAFDMKTPSKKRKWLERRLTGSGKVNLDNAVRGILRSMGGTATTPTVKKHLMVLYPRLKFNYRALWNILNEVAEPGEKDGQARIWHLKSEADLD